MKTGLDQNGHDNSLTDFQQNVAGIVAELLRAALTYADRYRSLAHRTAIHKEDIAMGLMVNVVEGSPFWADERMPERCQQAQNTLFSTSSSSEDDEDKDDFLHVADDDFEEWSAIDPLQVSASEFTFVRMMNNATTAFAAWRPTVPILVALRDATENLCA